MIAGVIIPLASECLTKQHLRVRDSRHVFVWSGWTLCGTFGSGSDDLTDCMTRRVCVCVPSLKCLITHFEAPTDRCARTFCWLMSQLCLYVYRVCALCSVYSWSRHPAPVSCLCCRWKQIESLETLGSRIWNMLMNRHNNNPSSHTRQKENEKLCKGFCLLPTLFQDQI